MTEKEFNRIILAELAKIAKDYFAELSIPAGTYTASELANGKKGKEEIRMQAPDEIRDARHVISLGSFRCEFTSESVFSLLYKFEKLAGVGQKDKAHFVRMDEPEGVICSFTADFGKGVKWAANHVTKDAERFPMTCAYLNVGRGELVATDSHILSVTDVPVTELSGELSEFPILLNIEMIKNLKGKCHVRVLEDGITVEDESGKQYTHTYESCRYPNYLSVIPKVSGKLRATFTPESIKAMFSMLKSAKKFSDNFYIDINKGERIAKITADWGRIYNIPSIQVELSRAPETDIHTAFEIEKFLKAKNWDGNMWFGIAGYLPVIMGDKCAKLTVLMPKGRAYEEYHSYKPARMSDAFEAVCATKAAEPKQAITKPAKEPEKAPETPNLPAPYVVADVSAVSFFEHLSELAAFLFAFFFEAETRRLLSRLQYLADLAGKPVADLVPEPDTVATTEPDAVAEPIPEPGATPSAEPVSPRLERIVARTIFAARFPAFRGRCRSFAPLGIHLPTRVPKSRNRGAKRMVFRAALSPPLNRHPYRAKPPP